MLARVPQIRNLQAFAAAGRLGSFKAAAKELEVSPSAISHRISGLEDFLGEKLFEPHGRGAVLTLAGRTYLQSIQRVFDQLNAATDRIRHRGVSGPLTIRLYPAFAHRWLIPRLPSFAETYPDVELNLVIVQEPLDFSLADTDVAIEYMANRLSGYRCDLLMAEDVVAICSPQYLASHGDAVLPEDLDRFTLIHNSDRPEQWQWWRTQVGLQARHGGRNLNVSNRDAAVDAAAAGLGIALAHAPLINDALQEGLVVSPLRTSVPVDHCYYLVTTSDRAELPRVIAFRDWILAEISQ